MPKLPVCLILAALLLAVVLPASAGARVTVGPGNDMFASAITLSGASGSTTGTNVGATKEVGEPALAGNSGGASVWFRWTAPASGSVTFNTAGSGFDTLLGVYTGTAVNALTLVAANDDVSNNNRSSSVTFTAAAGTTYDVTVDGYLGPQSGQAAGSITLAWNGPSASTPPPPPPSAPANDMFAAAQALSGSSGNVSGSNTGATKESGEPALAGNSGGASVWYAWTAPATGSVTFKTAGSAFDTLLGAYTGTAVNALTLVSSNDDVTSSDRTSAVTFNATAGTSYRITVDGYRGPNSGQAAGAIALAWTLTAAAPPPPPPPPPSGPANDNFANATALTGSSGTANGSNVNATKESGEPALAGNSGGASVWYSWTAPANGTLALDTSGSAFDTLLGAYTGSSVGALTLLASNDDVSSTDRTSATSFTVVGGTVYRITVDGYNGPRSGQAAGALNLHWTFNAAAAPPPPPPPSNGDPVVVAAGDVHANCVGSQAGATAQVVQGVPNALALMIGDSTDSGSTQQFTDCYATTWGAFKDRTRPVPGNHDYQQTNAAPYYTYFGALAGDPAKGYYSYDVGAWHVVALNSNCSKIGKCDNEVAWLKQDLAAHPATCTLAYFHHPLFSSTPERTGMDGPLPPLWQALYDGNADVILNAHSPTYERFAPQTPAGVADPARGIREFVVGTGGGPLDTAYSRAANSEVWQAQAFGVLQLTLHATSYDWRFLPVAGSSWTDSGTASCH